MDSRRREKTEKKPLKTVWEPIWSRIEDGEKIYSQFISVKINEDIVCKREWRSENLPFGDMHWHKLRLQKDCIE